MLSEKAQYSQALFPPRMSAMHDEGAPRNTIPTLLSNPVVPPYPVRLEMEAMNKGGPEPSKPPAQLWRQPYPAQLDPSTL